MMNVRRWGYRTAPVLGGALTALGCTSDKHENSNEAVSVSSEAFDLTDAKRKYWSKDPSVQNGTGESIVTGGGGSPSAMCPTGIGGVESAPPLPTVNGDVITVPGFGPRGISPIGEMKECSPGSPGNPDDLHFVYWGVSGDAEITARIADVVGPAGREKGQIGVMIRKTDDTSIEGPMGAGAFTVGAEIEEGTAACDSGVFEGASCSTPDAECFQTNSNYCRCTLTQSGNQWQCGLPGNQMFATWRNGLCYGLIPPSAIDQIKNLKIRLQRIGQHYSVSFQRPDETMWRPLHSVGGGEFAPVDADIGLFVSNMAGEACGTQNEVYAKFDQISVRHAGSTPPFVPEYRTTWLGSNRDQYCTMTANGCSGEISQDATSFHVFPGNAQLEPLIYKHTPAVEGGHTVQVIDANGKVERGTPRPLGLHVLQGAITQDPFPSVSAQPVAGESYAYVASGPSWGGVGPYCVDRLLAKTLKGPCKTWDDPVKKEVCVVDVEDTCGADGIDDPERRLTAIGGMAAVPHGTQNRLYVTQPDRDGDGNYTDDPRIVEMRAIEQNGLWRMEVNGEWPTPPNPGPITGGHSRLWVAHMPTNYMGANALGAPSVLTNMNNFDVQFDAQTSRVRTSVRCYHIANGLPCDSNSIDPTFGEIKGCVDANSDGKITGNEANGCVVNPVALAFRRGTTLASSELFIAENGIDQQFVRVFGNLHTATPGEVAQIGVPGGIYSGTKGLISDGANVWNRFYNLLGVGVDNAGGVYVSMNGLPGADIRKFTRNGTTYTYEWSIQGLLGFGHGQEIAVFDPGTDGADAYSFNKHFSFNTSVNNPPDASPPTAGGAMAPGSEWSLKSLTWDPHDGEKDVDGRYARDRGHTVIRRLNGERYMFVLSGDVSPSTYQPANTALPAHELITESRPGAPVSIKQAIHVYRFNGEIAVPTGSIEIIGIDTDPMPRCDDDCDCANDANRRRAYQIRSVSQGTQSWVSPASLDAFLDNTAPYCPVPTLGCPVHPDCINAKGEQACDMSGVPQSACVAPNACRAAVRVGHPKPELCPDISTLSCQPYPDNTCEPPDLSTLGAIPSGRIQGFDVDSNLDLWLVTNHGMNFPAKILRLPATITGVGPTYVTPLSTNPALAQYFSFTPAGTAQGIKVFPNGTNHLLFVLGESAIYRFATNMTSTFETQTLLGGSPWEPTEACAGYKAFDIAGDRIFVSNRCGAVEVYDKNFAGNSTAKPLILLSAGPELAGSQAWQDGEMGISAFRRTNGEYLVSTVESSPLPHNIVFRYNP
jgi:hypothetical protein